VSNAPPSLGGHWLSPHLPPEERCCFHTGDGLACRADVKRKSYAYLVELADDARSTWRSDRATPWDALKEALGGFAERDLWAPEWRVRQLERHTMETLS
jgi:hypothetical protein